MAVSRSIFSQEINLYYAKQALAYVRKMLPYGSVNKKTDEARPNFHDTIRRMADMRWEIESRWPGGDYLEGIPFQIGVYEKYGAGNCCEQALVAKNFLKKMAITDVNLCNVVESDHFFLVIGENVICDPWDNSAYPTSEFKERQQASKSVEYSWVTKRAFAERGESLPPPFLEGKLQVLRYGSNKDPIVANGQFKESKSDETPGTGKALAFGLARFSFLTKLAEAKIQLPESGVSRESLQHSTELLRELKLVP